MSKQGLLGTGLIHLRISAHAQNVVYNCLFILVFVRVFLLIARAILLGSK